MSAHLKKAADQSINIRDELDWGNDYRYVVKIYNLHCKSILNSFTGKK